MTDWATGREREGRAEGVARGHSATRRQTIGGNSCEVGDR